MGLNELNTDEMTGESARLLDPKRARPTVEKYPVAKATLPKLQEAHDGLVATQPDGSLTGELKGVMDEQAQEDGTHDRKARGIANVLTGLAELADDPEEAKSYIEAKQVLLHKGLLIVNESYSGEAGAAERTRERVGRHATVPALLRKVELPGENRTLSTEVDAWLGAGDRLGQLNAQRAVIEAKLSKGSTPPRLEDVVNARNQWIRAIRALMANVRLETTDEETWEVLFGPIAKLEKAARLRPKPNTQSDQTTGSETDGSSGSEDESTP